MDFETSRSDDPFNLDRFVQAQRSSYATALAEVRAGRKRSHWMWFIFPQIAGLGFSPTSQHYAIKSIGEARAYLKHALLRERLIECMEALLALQERSANEIFGWPDDMKLRSCATLFAAAAPDMPLFQQVLNRYFDGRPDESTLTLLSNDRGDEAA